LEVTHAAAAAGGKLRVFDFAFSLSRSYTFWSGVLGGTFLTMASHGTDQTLVQRLLAARNERDSKKALLASGVIVFVQFALFLVIGVMLFVYAQHNSLPVPGGDPDRIFPQFIVHDMPVGLTGLVLASIFAIAMSNASGSLNSLASSSIIDLIRWGPVLVAGLTITSITYGAMLGVFLLGTWNRRATENGALVGFMAGLVSLLAVKLFTPLAWTWYVLVGTLITLVIGSLASLAGGRPTHTGTSAPPSRNS
jgi:Na+/proline symporter